MGFLRKLGRKVKKGVKKLFSTKIGSILGGIALSTIIPWAAGEMFGSTQWYKSLTNALGNMRDRVTSVFKSPTDAVADIAPEIEADLIKFDTSTSVAPTKTKGLKIGDAISKNDLSSLGPKPEIPSNFNLDLESSSNIKGAKISDALETLDLESSSNIKGVKISDVTKDMKAGKPLNAAADVDVKSTFGEKVVNAKDSFVESFKEDFSAGDIAAGVASGYIQSEVLGGDYDEPVMGGVASQPVMEAAQGSYIQDISQSYTRAMGTPPVSFADISNQTLYGPGSPQSMAYIYQPLKFS